MKGVVKTHYTLSGAKIEREILLDDFDRKFVVAHGKDVSIDITNDVPKFYDRGDQKTKSLARAIIENRGLSIQKRISTKNHDPYDLRLKNINF